MNKETTRTTTSTSAAISGADEAVDRILAASRDKVIAALPDAVDQAMRETLPRRYTSDLAAAIAAQVIANLTGVSSTPCPVFRDCADTTPGHYDHFTHDIKVIDDTDGSTILDAGMVANSGSDRHVIVYLRNAEFTDPESVRAKTAEVRAFLDQVDEMADRVFADQQDRTQRAEAQA